jgi:N-acetylglucosaminyl-diphospho-decaprenol L-rhamnosyltransferase
MLDASIVIVNWNTAGLLIQCLESIYKTGSRYSLEVIVVDNGSQDDSVSLIGQHFPSVILLQNEQNLGFARANNQGLSKGRGRYFLLLNSDTIVLPGAIDTLIQIADSNPKLGVVGPKLLNMDGTVQKSWASFPSFLSELVGRNFRIRKPVANCPHAYDVDWIMGACMLVRSATVAEVGKFDDTFFFYSEETDWCYRIKEKNWRVWYITNAEIYHLGGGSTNRGTLAQLARLYQGKLIFFGKYHGHYRTVLLRYGLAFGNFLGLLRRILFFNWRNKEAAWQRITSQSKLVWYLLWNQYPEASKFNIKGK